MVRRATWVVAVGMMVAAVSTQASAALSAGQKMAVESLIKQFSAAEFDARQKAVDRLVELGPDVVPLVQKALADTADNEVKLRCQMVLKGIKEKYPDAVVDAAKPAVPATPAPKGPGKFGYDASRVTVSVKDAELDAALAALAGQSGNARLALPKDWEGKGVTFDARDLAYWQALDKLCASLGLAYVYDGQQRAFVLQPLAETVDVSAYAGPVVVKLDSMTVNKRFRGGFGRTSGLSIACLYYHEDRLSPLTSEGEITKLVGSDGKEIALDQAAATRGGRSRGGRGGRGTIFATAQTAPIALDKFASIEGVVRMSFGEGLTELKVTDALGGNDRSASAGNVKVTVTQSRRLPAGGRGRGGDPRGGNNDAAGSLLLTVKYSVDGKDEDAPDFARGSVYGFTLIDPKGERHASSGAFGGFAFGRGGPDQNPDNAQPNTMSLFFANAPDVDGAWTLVVALPAKFVEKTYAFKFTDVSLR